MVHASSHDGICTRPIRIRRYSAGLTGVDPMFRTLANNALALTGSVCTLPDLLREVFSVDGDGSPSLIICCSLMFRYSESCCEISVSSLC